MTSEDEGTRTFIPEKSDGERGTAPDIASAR